MNKLLKIIVRLCSFIRVFLSFRNNFEKDFTNLFIYFTVNIKKRIIFNNILKTLKTFFAKVFETINSLNNSILIVKFFYFS
jgi:hypothetical protein